MALDRRLPGPEAEPCVGGMRKACAWKSPRDLCGVKNHLSVPQLMHDQLCAVDPRS